MGADVSDVSEVVDTISDICDVAHQKDMNMMTVSTLMFILLEHFLSFKMSPYSLKFINAIRSYKLNTAGNSYCFPYF